MVGARGALPEVPAEVLMIHLGAPLSCNHICHWYTNTNVYRVPWDENDNASKTVCRNVRRTE